MFYAHNHSNILEKLTGFLYGFLPYILLLSACVFAYSNVYGNAFLFDDLQMIVANKFLHSWDNVGKIFTSNVIDGAGVQSRLYRPLQIFLYLIIYQCFGLSTIAFHALNISLHCLNACLGYRVGKGLAFPSAATFAGVLLWALHPIQTEAVTYMTSTSDLLACVFVLLGMLMLVEWTIARITYASAFLILALLSKEVAIVFPLLAMGLIFLQSGQARWKLSTYYKTLPFWLIAGGYFALKMWALQASGQGNFHPDDGYSENIYYRINTFFAVIPTYLGLLIMPEHLHMERNFPFYLDFFIWRVLEGVGLCLLMFAAVVWKPRYPASPLAWGVLWLMAAYLPYTGVLMRINGVMYEHWLYMPTLGFAIGGAVMLDRMLAPYAMSRPAAAILAGIVAVIFGYLTFEQNKVWRTPISFYENIFAAGELSARGHNNLGTVYYDANQLDKAIEQYQIAIKNSKNYAMAHYNLGISLARRGGSPEAIKTATNEILESIRLDPTYRPAYGALSEIYGQTGQKEKAAQYKALAEKP